MPTDVFIRRYNIREDFYNTPGGSERPYGMSYIPTNAPSLDPIEASINAMLDPSLSEFVFRAGDTMYGTLEVSSGNILMDSGNVDVSAGGLFVHTGNSAFGAKSSDRVLRVVNTAGNAGTEIGNSLNHASGNYSAAFGSITRAEGTGSFAFGNRTWAIGNNSTSFGSDTSALGTYSFVAGFGAKATGLLSMSFGRNMVVDGGGSFGIALSDPSWYGPLNQNATFAVLGGNSGFNTATPQFTVDVSGMLHTSQIIMTDSSAIQIGASRSPEQDSPANAGEICWDENALYVATQDNHWDRVTLGPVYGELAVHDASLVFDIPNGPQYTIIQNWLHQDASNHCTLDGSNGWIIPDKGGKFFVNGQFSFGAGSNNFNTFGAIFVGETEVDHLHFKRYLSTGADTGSASLTGFLDCPADCSISFRMRTSRGSTTSFVMDYANFNILRIDK